MDGDRNARICGFGRDPVAYRRLGAVEECRIIARQELSDQRREELGLGVRERPPREDPAKDGTEDAAKKDGNPRWPGP